MRPAIQDRLRQTLGLYRRQAHAVVAATCTAAAGVIGAVFLPEPWKLIVVALSAGVIVLELQRIADDDLRGGKLNYLMARDPEAQVHELARGQAESNFRDGLITAHFTITPETLTVACNYCEWRTTNYPWQLMLAPKHLHDVHPEYDPRISRWLRRRWTAWLGKRITTFETLPRGMSETGD